MGRFRETWSRLSPREQMLIAAAGVLAVLAVAYLAIVQPFLDRRAAIAGELAEKRDLRVWIANAAATIGGAGPGGGPAAPASPAAIEQSFDREGLAGAVARIEPSLTGIDVDLTGAPLDPLFRWLASAEATLGYVAGEAELVRGTKPGTADVRLRLTPAGRP